jgi:hypothetical protein
MSVQSRQVRIPMPRGGTAIGRVVSELSSADPVSGHTTTLVVDVDGSRYRVDDDKAEPL